MKKENTSMTMKDPCHSDILKQQGWLSDGAVLLQSFHSLMEQSGPPIVRIPERWGGGAITFP
jgi:hypothetical protein